MALILVGFTPEHNPTFRIAQSDDGNEKAVMKAEADRQLNAVRYYQEKGNNPAAINRIKTIVLEYPILPYVEEALAHASEVYLALDHASWISQAFQ